MEAFVTTARDYHEFDIVQNALIQLFGEGVQFKEIGCGISSQIKDGMKRYHAVFYQGEWTADAEILKIKYTTEMNGGYPVEYSEEDSQKLKSLKKICDTLSTGFKHNTSVFINVDVYVQWCNGDAVDAYVSDHFDFDTAIENKVKEVKKQYNDEIKGILNKLKIISAKYGKDSNALIDEIINE
jgi:hypothetical protein